jgi:hypothetical protein
MSLITTHGTLLKFVGPWRLAFAFRSTVTCKISAKVVMSLHILLQFISLFWDIVQKFLYWKLLNTPLVSADGVWEGERDDVLQLYTDWSGSIGRVTSQYGAEFTDQWRPEWLKIDRIIACCKQDTNAGTPSALKRKATEVSDDDRGPLEYLAKWCNLD